MEELNKELKRIYPKATTIDIHNMIQDLTDLCVCCVKATIQMEKNQVKNDDGKIPENSS